MRNPIDLTRRGISAAELQANIVKSHGCRHTADTFFRALLPDQP